MRQPDILHCIGNTSLVALRRIVPPTGARILVKMESENPTGSMKDRMALAMIEAAEADGRLDRVGASSSTRPAAPARPCPWSVRSSGIPCTS